MAEIQEQGGGGGKDGKARSKKMSTKVDLTAMVDLAFLLITFFMLTTTLSKPNIMPIIMPEKKDINEEDLEATKESQVLTLLLGGNDKVYFYEGITNAVLDSTDYSAEGLRAKILDKKDRVKAEWGEDEKDDTVNLEGFEVDRSLQLSLNHHGLHSLRTARLLVQIFPDESTPCHRHLFQLGSGFPLDQ